MPRSSCTTSRCPTARTRPAGSSATSRRSTSRRCTPRRSRSGGPRGSCRRRARARARAARARPRRGDDRAAACSCSRTPGRGGGPAAAGVPAAARGDRPLPRARARARAGGARPAFVSRNSPAARRSPTRRSIRSSSRWWTARARRSPRPTRSRAAPRSLLSPMALRPSVQDGVFRRSRWRSARRDRVPRAAARSVRRRGRRARDARAALRRDVAAARGAALIEASGADPWRVVADTDAVLAELATKRVPAELEGELLNAKAPRSTDSRVSPRPRARSTRACRRWSSPRAARWTTSSRACTKVLIGKVRARFDKEHPVWRRLRYSLSPGGKLQERRVASLEPVARPRRVVAEAVRRRDGARGARRGVHEHWLLEGTTRAAATRSSGASDDVELTSAGLPHTLPPGAASASSRSRTSRAANSARVATSRRAREAGAAAQALRRRGAREPRACPTAR